MMSCSTSVTPRSAFCTSASSWGITTLACPIGPGGRQSTGRVSSDIGSFSSDIYFYALWEGSFTEAPQMVPMRRL